RLRTVIRGLSSPRAFGGFARPGQRSDDPKPLGFLRGERVNDPGSSALVAEVVEVRDPAALVEKKGRAADARHAAIHRARLAAGVVVGPLVSVGTQRFQPGRDRVAFEVTGHDTQLSRNRAVGGVQPAYQRASWHLRRETRNLRWIRSI